MRASQGTDKELLRIFPFDGRMLAFFLGLAGSVTLNSTNFIANLVAMMFGLLVYFANHHRSNLETGASQG